MAVALGNLGPGVSLMSEGFQFQLAVPGAQAHGASQLVHAAKFAQLVDDPVRRARFELGAVSFLQAADVAGILDDGALHPQADAQEREPLGAGKLDSPQHSRNPPRPEPARHQNGVESFELSRPLGTLQVFRLHPTDAGFYAVCRPCDYQGLIQALVGVSKLHVLADHCNVDIPRGMRQAVGQFPPGFQVGLIRRKIQVLKNLLVQALASQHQRNVVNGFHVPGRDHSLFRDAAKQSHLLLELRREKSVRAADQNVGLNTDFA